MLRHIVSTLKNAVGWGWPWLMIRSLMDRSGVMEKTRWATDGVPVSEARYVKQFSLAAAVYLNLSKRIGRERAVETMRALLLTIGAAAVRKRFLSLDLSNLRGMDRPILTNNALKPIIRKKPH